jgi:hypothetical protein
MNTVFNRTFWHFALSFVGIVFLSFIVTGIATQFAEPVSGQQQVACPTDQRC